MDSGLDASHRPGMTERVKRPYSSLAPGVRRDGAECAHRDEVASLRPGQEQVHGGVVFRSSPDNGHRQKRSVCLKSADIVAKVFLGWRTKIPRADDASYARRREGPYRFIQNRSRTFAVTLKSDAAAEKSKDRLSRDFWGCFIFDFCNNIC